MRETHIVLCAGEKGSAATSHFNSLTQPGCRIPSEDVHRSRSKSFFLESFGPTDGFILLHQPRFWRSARCRCVRKRRCFIALEGPELFFSHRGFTESLIWFGRVGIVSLSTLSVSVCLCCGLNLFLICFGSFKNSIR